MVRGTKNGVVSRRYGCLLLAVFGAEVLLCHLPAVGEEIEWRSGRADIARLDGAELSAVLADLTRRPNAQHVVVQFDRPIDPSARSQAQQEGLTLLRYLGNNTFFAALSGTAADASVLATIPYLTGLENIARAWKLDPRILANEVPDWAVVAEDPPRGQIGRAHV